ncbi:hypothetical protein [Escherichia coli]|uniref:hypothetical protein n=1 Tax=Escherichia coli TaxID=562 RepID=UPI001F4D5A14|nr:hypothetical protein [Escherichia coli]MCH9253461.1 hypothetical protein [Escherichia coli]
MPDATLGVHAASASGAVQLPDATLAAFYPARRIAHVGRIRRLRRIRQQLQIIAYGKNRYTT